MDDQGQALSGPDSRTQARKVDGFASIEAQSLSARPLLKLAGQDAHAHQIAAMDTLKAPGHKGADSQETCSLGCPVAGASCSVLVARDNDQGSSLLLVTHGGIIDAHSFAIRMVHG